MSNEFLFLFLEIASVTFKCSSNEKSAPHTYFASAHRRDIIFLTNTSDYVELVLGESLCVKHSHDALGTACPCEVMWVSQWGWGDALSRAATKTCTPSVSAALGSQLWVFVFSIIEHDENMGNLPATIFFSLLKTRISENKSIRLSFVHYRKPYSQF